jgi:hypothetical protein
MFPRPAASRLVAAATVALALAGGPGPARARQFIRETYYLAPTERVVISDPYVTTSRSYVVPTSVVYESPATVLSPSSYVVARTRYGLFGRPRETEYVVPRSYGVDPLYDLTPTAYRSVLTPTYYTESYRPVYVSPRRYIVPTREVIVDSPVYDEYIVPAASSPCDEETLIDRSAPPATSRPEAAAPPSPPVDEPSLRPLPTRETQGAGAKTPAQSKVIESEPSAGAEKPVPVVSNPPAAVPADRDPLEPAPLGDLVPPAAPSGDTGTAATPPATPEPAQPVQSNPDPPVIPGPAESTLPLDAGDIPLVPEIERRATFRPAFPSSPTAVSTTGLVNPLEGRVLDQSTRRPLSGLQVVLSDQKDRYPDRTATTDYDGRFVVADVPDGDWSVTIQNPSAAGTARRYGVIRVTAGRPFDSAGRSHDRLILNY